MCFLKKAERILQKKKKTLSMRQKQNYGTEQEIGVNTLIHVVISIIR